MSLEPGTKLDRYTIEALLGEGAMGKVYRAFDARLERAVAIKVLEGLGGRDGDTCHDEAASGLLDSPEASLPGPARGAGGDAVDAVLREARAAAAILHPNATSIFDADRIGDTSFIVMELVPGTSLRRFVGDPALPVPTRVRWLVDVAGALGAAHRAGVVHRDIKPENILVRDDGLVKVLDFGIARRPRAGGGAPPGPPGAPTPQTPTPDDAGPASFSTLTSAGSLVGTPAYMAPEQIRGEDLDGRADQFSWGVLAYELLTGRLPWAPADPLAILAAILTTPPVPFPTAPGVPPGVADTILRALSKSPRDRFPSMADAAAALAPHAGARRPLRRATLSPPGSSRRASEPPPSSNVPSGHAAVELGFFDQVAPTVGSVPPPSAEPRPVTMGTSPPNPAASADPLTRTLTSGQGPITPPRLRPPDFSAPVDVDGHLALLRPDATCKGVFFTDLIRLGAPALPATEIFHLAGVPEHRYMVFRDYPFSDYLRLMVTVALAVHATLPLGEGLRRVGQTAFRTALGSLVGKTLFGVYGNDLEPLLFTAPRAYRVFLNVGDVAVEKTGPRTYRFTLHSLPAFLETYQVGVLEGVLRHCGAAGRIRILVEALDRATMELEVD